MRLCTGKLSHNPLRSRRRQDSVARSPGRVSHYAIASRHLSGDMARCTGTLAQSTGTLAQCPSTLAQCTCKSSRYTLILAHDPRRSRNCPGTLARYSGKLARNTGASRQHLGKLSRSTSVSRLSTGTLSRCTAELAQKRGAARHSRAWPRQLTGAEPQWIGIVRQMIRSLLDFPAAISRRTGALRQCTGISRIAPDQRDT